MSLADNKCVPCRGGVPPLAGPALEDLLRKLGGGWSIIDGHHLEKEFTFRNFREALAFANRVGELAEQVNHHPDLEVSWGRVKVTVFTHKINGLSETDFVFAAKTDAL